MRAPSVAATRSARPWLAFLAGCAVGFAILILTQVLSDTQLQVGPWALNGNGALAVPFVGFPVAIYAGWTVLADRHEGRELTIELGALSLGLVLGSFPLGVLCALPMVPVTGALYAIWMRGSAVKRSDRLLWITFARSIVLAALPPFGLFGIGLLPGPLVLLARRQGATARVALGAMLAIATLGVVFVAPAALYPMLLAPSTTVPVTSAPSLAP